MASKLGKKRDAAEHLAYAIKSYPPSGKPEVKQRLEIVEREHATAFARWEELEAAKNGG